MRKKRAARRGDSVRFVVKQAVYPETAFEEIAPSVLYCT
jgi:hypothetical protein